MTGKTLRPYHRMGYIKYERCLKTLRQVFICLSPLPFGLGWSSNFVALNQVRYRVKLLQNMVSNRTQNPPPPLPATHCMFVLYIDTGKGRREGWMGNSLEISGSKYQHDERYLQSINSDKYLPQSPK
jgi:hypothetical protein